MNQYQIYIILLLVYFLLMSIMLYIKPLMKYFMFTKDRKIITEFEYNSKTIKNLLPWVIVLVIPISFMRTDLIGGLIIASVFLPQIFIIMFNNKIRFYEKGLFFQKRFIYWEQVEGIELVNDENIKLEVLMYTNIDILINQVDNKKEFLKIVTSKANIDSEELEMKF